jgi:Endoplasmic reticulum protein ERp29, C-terminal domain
MFYSTARYYGTFMNRILEKGDAYAKNELSRLSSIISSGSVDLKKRDGFYIRMNILKVFAGEAESLSDDQKTDAIHPDDIFKFDHEDL